MLQRTIMIGLLLAVVSPARAAVESELIKQGVAAYEDLDYPKAIDFLQKALRETLTREEKVVTWRTLGFSHAALNQMKLAQSDFENLLRVDPRAELDRTVAPRVRAVFDAARGAVATGTTMEPTPEHTTPTVEPTLEPAKPKEGRPLSVSVLYQGGIAEKMVLFHRVRGQENFSRIEEKSDEHGKFIATIPGLAVRAPGLDFYLELLDDGGVAMARGGSLGAPLAVDVAAHKKPLYARGWFWGVIAGVAVVGAVVATAVVLTRPNIGPNSPASLTIMPF